MNPRFFLILALITATLLAWTYIQNQYEDSKQFRLQQLSALPIYVYMDDAAAMDSLAAKLQTSIPQVDSLFKETGVHAAKALLKDYQLGIEPNTLNSYKFPNILTITFQPDLLSFAARDTLLATLKRNNISSADIDNQEAAWNLVKKEIDYLRTRWGNTTLFTAMLVFLLLLFARLYLFLAQAKKTTGRKQTILETIRSHETKRWQSALLVLVPILVNIVFSLMLLALKVYKAPVDWYFFGIEAISIIAAIGIAILLDSMREPEEAENNHHIYVTTPKDDDA